MKKLLIISTVVFSTVFLSQASKANGLTVEDAFYSTKCEFTTNNKLFRCMITELVDANCKKGGISKKSIKRRGGGSKGRIDRRCYYNAIMGTRIFLRSEDFLISNRNRVGVPLR